LFNTINSSNDETGKRGGPPEEVVADETWQNTSERIVSVVMTALAVACLILIDLNPFYRPSTNEVAAAINRNYMFSTIDEFISRYLGRPGEQPWGDDWFPELTHFEAIINSIPDLVRDVVSELQRSPPSCLNAFSKDYDKAVDVANKLQNIDREIVERRLTAKRKDDLTIYDVIEIPQIFRGYMGHHVRQFMKERKWHLDHGQQNWVCNSLSFVTTMGDTINTYRELGGAIGVSEWPQSQLKFIEQERVILGNAVVTTEKVVPVLTSKTLADFYERMARERNTTKEAVEAYVGGKGLLKDYLPEVPFFWLVAGFPLICCWAYLRMIALVSRLADLLRRPHVILNETGQTTCKTILGYRNFETEKSFGCSQWLGDFSQHYQSSSL
jgi:hypothetical protein